jgi:hypothetical protein
MSAGAGRGCMRMLYPQGGGRFHSAPSVSPPFPLNELVVRRLFDVVMPEMGSHICRLTEAVVLVPIALLLLHHLYLATLVHLRSRLESTSVRSEHKNYVRSPFLRVYHSPLLQDPFSPISD